MSRGILLIARFLVIAFVIHWATSCTEPEPLVPWTLNNRYDTLAPTYVPLGVINFVAKVISETSVLLSWTDVSVAEKGFLLLHRVSSSSVFDTLTILPSNTVSYTDTVILQTGITHVYSISAIGNSGLTSSQASVSVALAFSAPFDLRISHISAQSVNIEWSDTNRWATHFRLERAEYGGPFFQLAEPPLNQMSYTDEGLNSTKQYEYRVYGLSQYNSLSTRALSMWFMPDSLALIRTIDIGQYQGKLAMNAEGDRLVVCGYSSFIIMNPLNGNIFSTGPTGIPALSLNMEGSLVAIGIANGANAWIEIRRLVDGELVTRVGATENFYYHSVMFGVGDTVIFAGKPFGEIEVWNLRDSVEVYEWIAHGYVVEHLVLSANGERLLSWSSGPSAPISKIWSVPPFTHLFSLSNLISIPVFIPDGSSLVAFDGSTVSRWDATTGTKVQSIAASIQSTTLALTADGKFGFGGEFNRIVLYRAIDFKLIRIWENGPSASICVNAKGTLLAGSQNYSPVHVWAVINRWTTMK